MKKWWVGKLLKIAVIAVVVFAVGGYIVMALWNWLAPSVFGGHAITFWQGVGLLVLCRILFGRLGMGHGGRHGGKRWMSPRERYQHMSPEEKTKFKKKIMDRWGISDEPGASES